MARLEVPGSANWSDAKPASKRRLKLTTGTALRSATINSMPLLRKSRSKLSKLTSGKTGRLRQLRPVGAVAVGAELRKRPHFEVEGASVEPAPGRIANRLRRRVLQAFE